MLRARDDLDLTFFRWYILSNSGDSRPFGEVSHRRGSVQV